MNKKTYNVNDIRLLHPMLGQYPRDNPNHPMYGKKDVFESYLETKHKELDEDDRTSHSKC